MRRLIMYVMALCFFFSSTAAMAADVGERAVDFSGASTAGEIKLSHYLGKKNVVLALFFRAFTPV
ncbi:MAG: hypothetical protein OEV42_12450 [Deltaproteobacteria bacterium]|nr:hypothetical protein [Deltaproteobacteria bacterium]